jgi:coproporphyrinogen III oxidase-like Fe-S oxidoreductase
MKPTVGIGPSAVGILPRPAARNAAPNAPDDSTNAVVAERHTNPRSFHRYLASGDYGVSVTPVTARELLEEHFMMGFRRNDGVNPTTLEEIFGLPLTHLIPGTSTRWSRRLRTFDVASHGTIERRISLDREGLLLLDHFLVDVFHELDTTYDGTVPPVRWPLPSTVHDIT